MANVYVFQTNVENLFKIGRIRGDVANRRKDLFTSNPHPLTIFRVIETNHDSLFENFLHKKCAGSLSAGAASRSFTSSPPLNSSRV